MDNIFEQYGIKEVADATLYAIELDENDDEIYIPVLYMDTLKVSTVEESIQSSSAQGGIGNPKLITWDYGKDITVTLEDALFTPSSSSMNWAAKLGTQKLHLYLRYFFDRNIDNNTPDNCLRTATLTAEKFSDFLVIPDRYPLNEDIKNHCDAKTIGYVGGMSIYCWLVSGNITSDDGKIKVMYQDLILFYREQTQKWYFFNGRGPTENPMSWYLQRYNISDKKHHAIGYQYGKDVFNWIKENIAIDSENQKRVEYEPVANSIISAWKDSGKTQSDIEQIDGVPFLTQNLFIDGFRSGCVKNQLYSEFTEEELANFRNGYVPYRHFANIGVEYNTNIAPPQECIYSINTAIEDVFLLEKMEKIQANRTFCIDTDVNMMHGQYRFLEKYSQTPLTVFIDPRTMQPYLPNTYEYYRENGQRITGNLAIIKKGSTYYKWSRSKAAEDKSIGNQLIIDAQHYPGMYRLVGETTIRDRYGKDTQYQFEIPLCKLHPENKLTLQSSGDPVVFSMKLNAVRRYDGVMMKLTAYDLLDKQCCCSVDKRNVKQTVSAQPELTPRPFGQDIEHYVEPVIHQSDV